MNEYETIMERCEESDLRMEYWTRAYRLIRSATESGRKHLEYGGWIFFLRLFRTDKNQHVFVNLKLTDSDLSWWFMFELL